MTLADLEMWSAKMRTLGVRTITTKEFSIELDPFHPESVPPMKDDEDELSLSKPFPADMCKRCGVNPPNATFTPGICRDCDAKQVNDSVRGVS